MNRKLATIEIVSNIQPIKKSDNLELITIKGWHAVVTKNSFTVGQLCVYCEIDSFLPIYPCFEFLRSRCYQKLPDGTEGFRIHTMRFRGELSQGLCLSLDIFNQIPNCSTLPTPFVVGTDVSKYLGITKYEEPIPSELDGKARCMFPNHLVYDTEMDRVQNISDNQIDRYKDTEFYATEKIDGTSCTFIKDSNIIHVCSKNVSYLESDNDYWKIYKKYNIERIFNKYDGNLAIQGEMIGPNISKNKYKLDDLDFYVFNIFDVTNKKYFSLNDLIDFCEKEELKMVPVIIDEYKLKTINSDDVVELTYGNSQINNQIQREGLVFKSKESEKEKIMFKVINPKFLLKYELIEENK